MNKENRNNNREQLFHKTPEKIIQLFNHIKK